MRVTILASSSAGNVTLIQAGETAVLIDIGLSAKMAINAVSEVKH